MLPRDGQHALQHFPGIERAGGVVGVDDHDAARPGGDLAPDVFKVGVPQRLLIQPVEDRLAVGQPGRVAPERIAGGRHQQLIPRVEHGGKQHAGQLAHAVAQVDIIHPDALQAFAFMILEDRFPGLRHAAQVAVGHRPVHSRHQGAADAVGHLKAENAGVAGVQLHHLDAFPLHSQRFLIQGAADIGTNLFHALCLLYHVLTSRAFLMCVMYHPARHPVNLLIQAFSSRRPRTAGSASWGRQPRQRPGHWRPGRP